MPVIITGLYLHLNLDNWDLNNINNETMATLPIKTMGIFTLSILITRLTLVFPGIVKLKKLYKKELLNQLSIKKNKPLKYKKCFEKLRSIRRANYYEYEDAFQINKTTDYFEVETSTSGKNKNYKHYQVIVLSEIKDNGNFHITSKGSSFITASNIKYETRTKEVFADLFNKLYKPIFFKVLVPFIKLLYKPLSSFYPLNKEGTTIKKDNLGKYVLYSMFILSVILILVSIGIELMNEIFGKDLAENILFFIFFGPMLLAWGYSYLSKNKAKENYQSIDLDNLEFNKRFDIHTEDKITSYKFLRPENLEKLLLLTGKYNLAIELFDNKVFLVFDSIKNNRFELKVFKSLDQLFSHGKSEFEEIKILSEQLSLN